MFLQAVWLAVLPLLFTADALPHRNGEPGEPRGIPILRTSWNEIRRTPTSVSGNRHGPMVAEKSSTERLMGKMSKTEVVVPDRAVHVPTFSKRTNARQMIPDRSVGQHVPTFTEKSNANRMVSGIPVRVPLQAKIPNKVQMVTKTSNKEPVVAVRSSTERRSKRPLTVKKIFAPTIWRPKTVTKKLAGRPTSLRKYPSQLLTDTIKMVKQPKCHMPWINELSKIQFYYDGINALCDLAMTFEPCSTSGSVCRQHPVEFTCCPSTSLAVLKRCYKDQAPPENVCLPTTVQMSGLRKKPKRGRRPLINIPRRQIKSRTLITPPVERTFIPGCSLDCSPAWVNMFSNIKPLKNDSLPVCEFRDVFQSCAVPDGTCASHPVGSTCCPLKCIPDLEKCFVENPPEFVCTPKTLQPWISRIRKYFTG